MKCNRKYRKLIPQICQSIRNLRNSDPMTIRDYIRKLCTKYGEDQPNMSNVLEALKYAVQNKILERSPNGVYRIVGTLPACFDDSTMEFARRHRRRHHHGGHRHRRHCRHRRHRRHVDETEESTVEIPRRVKTKRRTATARRKAVKRRDSYAYTVYRL